VSACKAADRLSQISTMWIEMARIRGGAGDDARAAAASLIERYQEAAYGYLLTAVRDPDRATELLQEFALRFLRGRFRHFDPNRGRFRDYLRTALMNLVRDSYAAAGRPRPVEADPDRLAGPAPDAPEPDDSFIAAWRQALLNSAWRALEEEQERGGPPYYAALRARAEWPDCPSAELAARLTARLRPAEPLTDAGVRKLLQRGRDLFADRVVEEVARSVPTRDPDRVARELIDLGFYWFCKKTIARWPA
jgi:RNA polymerase sigma-70 factor (ECF subfamily)